MDLKRTIEAILFASAKRLTTHKIAMLCRKSEEEVEQALQELKKETDEADRPAKLIQEGDTWRLSVKEQYLPVVRKIVTKTELPKSILETLAVVAYKAPALQSKVIRIRTNKAYDHLNKLEEQGFITREKSGRTKLIRLSSKFYEYFDIDAERLKSKFTNAEEIEKAIERKEEEVKEYEPIQEYEESDKLTSGVEIIRPKIGELDIYDTVDRLPPAEAEKEIMEAIKEAREVEHEAEAQEKEAVRKQRKQESKGLTMDEEMEKRVDKRVAELLGKTEEETEKE